LVPATEQTTLKEKNQHLNLPLSWHLKNKTLLQCFHSQAHTSIGGFQRIQEQIIQTVDQKNFTGDNMKSIFSSQSNYYTVTNQIMPCECIAIQHYSNKEKEFQLLIPLVTFENRSM